MKTAICGYSGSGKSTLARRIGEIEQVPVLYLDTVQFVANWQERNRVEARSIVRAFMKQENWVIDGNYTNFFYQERMEAADRILILAFNRFTCLYRAFKRYLIIPISFIRNGWRQQTESSFLHLTALPVCTGRSSVIFVIGIRQEKVWQKGAKKKSIWSLCCGF